MKKKNMKEETFKIDFPTEIIQEGKVKVLVPKLRAFVKSPSEYAPSKAPVFYNPVMELNRDIAVLALQAYQRTLDREISVCEPLAGCGIRGIRFATEVEGVERVVINHGNRFGLFPSESKKVVPNLLKYVWDVVCRESNRRLEYHDFLELFEKVTTISIPMQHLKLLNLASQLSENIGS